MKALKKDLTPSPSRLWYNDWVERHAVGKVLDVGKSRYWDYGYDTIDTNPKLNPTFVGDICYNNIPAQSYDVVLCNGMYEFVADPQGMVNAVKRLLRPGGVAIFGFVGKNYKPYRKPWQYYDNNILFFDIIETMDFDNYHFIVCQNK